MRRHLSRGITLAIGAVVSNVASSLPAQEWHVSAQAGRIRSVVDPSSAASESFALGLRFDDPNAGLRVSAGIPRNASEALWSSVGRWSRLAPSFNGFRAGIHVAGNAYLTKDRSPPDIPLPGPLNPPE